LQYASDIRQAVAQAVGDFFAGVAERSGLFQSAARTAASEAAYNTDILASEIAYPSAPPSAAFTTAMQGWFGGSSAQATEVANMTSAIQKKALELVKESAELNASTWKSQAATTLQNAANHSLSFGKNMASFITEYVKEHPYISGAIATGSSLLLYGIYNGTVKRMIVGGWNWTKGKLQGNISAANPIQALVTSGTSALSANNDLDDRAGNRSDNVD
jgi:ElaB/YqjD/DUF883 family membrane-anchored ribosome-binding protein